MIPIKPEWRALLVLKLRHFAAEENLRREEEAMEVFRFSIITDEEFEKREGFRRSINLCPQCDNSLEFSYNQDAQFAVLEENAHCPNCLYKTDLSRHRVN